MQSISSTQGQLAIVELSPPFERLEIQFMPTGLAWSRTPDLPALAVVGRNNPHYHLTGGEDRLNLRLDFATELESRLDVIRKVQWLRSLTFAPVRNVKLVWGQLFKSEVWVVASFKADMDQFMHNANMLPQQAYVDITLALDPKKNLRLRDVRR
jgi:hypothetical protein